jgi:hypothetical protein
VSSKDKLFYDFGIALSFLLYLLVALALMPLVDFSLCGFAFGTKKTLQISD